jgi:NADH-quinone oxidoreductase subunit J
VLFLELALVLGGWQFAPESSVLRMSTMPEGVENTRALGRLIYTDYIFLFQASGLILMVAMIGAIVLTHRDRPRTRKQNIGVQVARSSTLDMVSMKLGAGVPAADILRPLPPPAPPEPAHSHDAGGHH